MRVIRERQFIQLATLLPVVVPVVAVALLGLRSVASTDVAKATPFDSVLLIIAMSLPIGGLPYVLLVLPLLLILRGRPISWYRTFVLSLPLFYSGLIALLCLALDPLLLDTARSALMLSGIALALGYGYVLIALSLGACLAKAGCVAIEDAAA